MAFQFTITTGSGVPIYKQLVDQVKAAVASGGLGEGDPLPSIRALSERIVINPNTAAKAYGEMAREGLIVTTPGKGYFIAARRQMLTLEERNRRLEAAASAFAREVVLLEFPRDHLLEEIKKQLILLESAGK
jgi:GntR family transcriptional regulator